MAVSVYLVVAILVLVAGIAIFMLRAMGDKRSALEPRHPDRAGALDREGVAARRARPGELAGASERLANRD